MKDTRGQAKESVLKSGVNRKAGLFREKHTPQKEFRPSQRAERLQNMGWLVCMSWIISG